MFDVAVQTIRFQLEFALMGKNQRTVVVAQQMSFVVVQYMVSSEKPQRFAVEFVVFFQLDLF